jgi:hypothetical protein
MIIDKILDRKDGIPYTQRDFNYILDEAKLFDMNDLANALQSNQNKNIIRELENYIKNNNYNLELVKYVKTQNWERR